ncbi:hypothetical protein [Microvirga sp. VF16]|uniref:hypothetical protein n=1 Tax=Microvirga sp. VF16 TaxID=2807101 RepID=UPI00193C8D45|nr:hypothetical protein [Microvirga sp. VF16]QRM34206.1 hypothetical protein JO965_33685 [Microvirga sp. VF16]
MRTQPMTLTPEHVAQVHRVLDDPGPDSTWTYHTDEDYAALVRGLVAQIPLHDPHPRAGPPPNAD